MFSAQLLTHPASWSQSVSGLFKTPAGTWLSFLLLLVVLVSSLQPPHQSSFNELTCELIYELVVIVVVIIVRNTVIILIYFVQPKAVLQSLLASAPNLLVPGVLFLVVWSTGLPGKLSWVMCLHCTQWLNVPTFYLKRTDLLPHIETHYTVFQLLIPLLVPATTEFFQLFFSGEPVCLVSSPFITLSIWWFSWMFISFFLILTYSTSLVCAICLAAQKISPTLQAMGRKYTSSLQNSRQ